MNERGNLSQIYAKKNHLEKINNLKLNFNKKILKKSFSQNYILLKSIKLNRNSKSDISLHNLSSGKLINHNSSLLQTELLKDINENKTYNYIYSDKKTIPKISPIESKKSKDNKNISNNFIHDFLHQKTVISYKKKNFSSKSLKPFKTKEIIKKNVIFYLKKNIIFEREINKPSFYGNFQNYKQNISNTNNRTKNQEQNQSNSSHFINNTSISKTEFPMIRKIYNLKKHLIEDDKRNTNGNFPYKDHDEEKKDTLLRGINPDNSIRIIKKRLTKNYNIDPEKIKAYINKKDYKMEDNNYLKKIILNNRLKNGSQLDLKNETYEEKNRKILNVINNYFQYRNRNKSQEGNLKMVNLKNEAYLKKRRMKQFSNNINSISHILNNLNKKINDALYSVKESFNEDIKSLFN